MSQKMIDIQTYSTKKVKFSVVFVFLRCLKPWLKMQQTVIFHRGDSDPKRAATVILKVGILLLKEDSHICVQPCHAESSSFTGQGSTVDTSIMSR